MKIIHRKLTCILLITSIYLVIDACKKDKTQTPEEEATEIDILSNDEKLTSKQMELLDSLEIDTTSYFSDFMFDEDTTNLEEFLQKYDPNFLLEYPTGRINTSLSLSPEEAKKLLISRMLRVGMSLTTRENYKPKNEGVNKPEQYGLAYVYGSKDHKVRNKGAGKCNTDVFLYGLDCSGMIYEMAVASSLKLPLSKASVAQLRNVDNWNLFLKNSEEYKELKMLDLGSTTQFELGDIIVWNGHIGMFANNLEVFSSKGHADTECSVNTDKKHGPSLDRVTKGFLSDFGAYKVLRVSSGCKNKTIKISNLKAVYDQTVSGSCTTPCYYRVYKLTFDFVDPCEMIKNSATSTSTCIGYNITELFNNGFKTSLGGGCPVGSVGPVYQDCSIEANGSPGFKCTGITKIGGGQFYTMFTIPDNWYGSNAVTITLNLSDSNNSKQVVSNTLSFVLYK